MAFWSVRTIAFLADDLVESLRPVLSGERSREVILSAIGCDSTRHAIGLIYCSAMGEGGGS
jgi:hypothetical protein